MSGRKHTETEAQTSDPTDAYMVAVEAIAAATKKLIDAGMGAAVAADAALKLWGCRYGGPFLAQPPTTE